MIESNIIKRFIVKIFMQNSECSIQKIANIAISTLSSRFMLNENIFIPSREQYGKIVKCNKDAYTIQFEDKTIEEVPFQDIKRRYNLELNDICHFLECITTVTPLGRILVENVFEKITQPGFGARKLSSLGFGKMNPRGIPDRRSKIFQEIEYSSHLAPHGKWEDWQPPVEQIRSQTPKVEISSLSKLEIEGFYGADLKKLIKIYSYFSKFGTFINFTAGELKDFANEIRNPEYNSETVMTIHKFLIETIEKDIGRYGMKFTNELALIIRRLPEYKPEISSSQSKKRSTIDIENWKPQVKIFLQNLSVDSDSERPLQFQRFVDPNTLTLRLDLIGFLITISYFTDTLRSIIQAAQNSIKNERLQVDMAAYGKRGKDESDDEGFSKELSMLKNPLRVHIGKYRDYFLILIEHGIFLKDNDDFYILQLKDARTVLKDLDPYIKAEKNTFTNLKLLLEELNDLGKIV